ncbi:MAG: DegT/DnrJ/EryC1/StrS family aminotransferase [Nanoarchaeota archaeon]|nr:DegT/DnrJ/EryC1/StrS family aminotransferase [Nanoarchaeota archaeon]
MIPQIEPWIDEEELKEITEVIKSTWLTEGEKTKEFEEMFRDLTGAKFAHAFCNGTATLFTTLKVLGVGEGDEVIVPNLTFTASINTILFAGAKPILVDVDKRTFNIDPDLIEGKITSKTKAIMPVHLYGQSADIDKIMKIAKEHNLFVVEDAAQGVGVKFNGQHVGTFGDFGSFSFYGNKTITTGEGGLLITNDEKLAFDSYAFKNHGRLKKGVFVHDKIGFNFSFTEMQAAIGLAQMRKLDKIIKLKEKIRNLYLAQLKDILEVELTFIDPRCSPVHWFTNIIVLDPVKLAEFLKEKGIQTRRFFYPIHKQPCYQNLKFGDNFPNSQYAYEHGLSLPSSVLLKEEEIAKVCEEIKNFYRDSN